MRRTTFAILVFPLVFFVASGCEKKQSGDPAAAQAETTKNPEDQPSEDGTAQSPTHAKEEASSGVDEEKAVADPQPKRAVPGPSNGVAVSSDTPKGHAVSFAVPSTWIELPRPNQDTLLVRAAPTNDAAEGMQVTLVAVEFVGGRDELLEHVKQRLSSFATIESEEALRIGEIDGYKLTAKWPTPAGPRDTVQSGVAMGQEAIAVTCNFPPGKLGSLGGLCEEILATLSIKETKP